MKRILLSLLALLLAICTLISCGASKNSPSLNSTAPTAPESNGNSATGPTEPTIPETPIDQFEFTAGNDGYTVTKYLGSDSVIVIPSLYDNKKVTDLDKTVFSGNIVLESVTLSKYMTEIDLADFNGCDALTTIIYPGDTAKTKSYTGPANLTALGLPGTKKITYDHHFSDIVKSNEKLTTLDFSGMESLYVNTFNGSCYEGLSITVSDVLYDELQNSATYHHFNVYRSKNEYSLTKYSLYKDVFEPEIAMGEMVDISTQTEYHAFTITGNQILIETIQNSFLEMLLNYRNYDYYQCDLFDAALLPGSMQACQSSIQYYYCYNPAKGEKMPDEVLYKNTDNADLAALYEDYNVYDDSYIAKSNMGAVYATFVYEGKTYEAVYKFKYGVAEIYNEEINNTELKWTVISGDDNFDNLVLHCDKITDENCPFTTYFGCVSTITVNGTKYSYSYE